MTELQQNLSTIKSNLLTGVELVAVSKTKPVELLMEAYQVGQRIFGENKVQEMSQKHASMPKDIKWHMIGHLQRNKVKEIVSYVDLIHGVDSPRLLREINKESVKQGVTTNCLLQIHVAEEETKFGFDVDELMQLLKTTDFGETYPNVRVQGLMTMATFTDDQKQIEKEFEMAKSIFDQVRSEVSHSNLEMKTLSMGMSGDYQIAMNHGSNMVRVGSSIFGSRN